jgi:predicted AAA+ superfamily ATPase
MREPREPCDTPKHAAMHAYLRRVLDDELDAMTAQFAAVCIDGAKAVGKTETAQRRARTSYRLDGPAGEVAAADPRVVTRGEPPVLIDEWQRVPATWDAVRRAVDGGAPPGSYLLAGSASEHGAHTGAGRIMTMRMWPLTLSERGVERPTVSLADLLGGARASIEGQTSVGLEDYAREIVGSGFPAALGLPEDGCADFLDSYLQRIVECEFDDLGRRVRRPATLMRWMSAYAAATASTASLETIRDAATGGEGEKPAKTTIQPYREILQRLFVVEPLPAWSPTRSRIARLAMGPKHHLADPGLAAALLGAGAGALLSAEPLGPPSLRDGALLGALFESLVTLCVRVYAQAARARVGHMRTRNGGHEVDLIVERRDGRILAIEVKLGAVPDDYDVRHLHWLARRVGDDLLDAAVVTTGPYAYRRPDGIAVVPAVLLGP